MLAQVIVAGFATVSFSILFSTPRKEFFYCALTGAIGWFFYLVIFEQIHSVTMGTFVAAMSITLISKFFAVNRKVPVTVFLIAGIFPLVPGTGIYYTAYYLFLDNTALASEYGREAMAIALAIAFGIMIIFLVPLKWFQIRRK